MAAVALRAGASYAMTIFFALAGNRVLTRVRAQVYAHLNALSMDFHDRRRTGDLVTRVTGDVGRLQDATITALLPALFASVAPPGSANIPMTVGGIALGITVIAALAALSARETHRIRGEDLGKPDAVPIPQAEYDRLRAQALAQR